MTELEPLYQDGVTLFNRVAVNDSFVWLATLIKGVHFIPSHGRNPGQFGETNGDTAQINVQYTGSHDKPVIGGKHYLSPKEWRKHTVSELENCVTFQYGEDFDVIYGGEWDGEAIIEDADYERGFYDYLNKNYDSVFAIINSAQYKLIPHFTLNAR